MSSSQPSQIIPLPSPTPAYPPPSDRIDPHNRKIIPPECFIWINRGEGFWRVNHLALAEWREANPAPPPDPDEEIKKAVKTLTDHDALEEEEETSAFSYYFERVAVLLFHALTFYGTYDWLSRVAPQRMAMGVSIVVVGTTYALLDGMFAKAPKRRVVAIALMATIGIYGSAATWRHELIGENGDSRMGQETHAKFAAEVYQPKINEAIRLRAAVGAVQTSLTEEIEGVGSTPGFGANARMLRDQRQAAEAKAAEAEALVAQLKPYFGEAVKDYTATQLHEAAVQVAAITGASAPSVDEYGIIPPLAIPLYRLKEGEPEAVVGFGIASAVDFVGIVLLGSAIQHRKNKSRKRLMVPVTV